MQFAVATVFGPTPRQSEDSAEPEARVCFGPLSTEAKDEHARCGHVPHRPDCEACQEALLLRRIHRSIPVDSRSTAVLSLDLTGPHPEPLKAMLSML